MATLRARAELATIQIALDLYHIYLFFWQLSRTTEISGGGDGAGSKSAMRDEIAGRIGAVESMHGKKWNTPPNRKVVESWQSFALWLIVPLISSFQIHSSDLRLVSCRWRSPGFRVNTGNGPPTYKASPTYIAWAVEQSLWGPSLWYQKWQMEWRLEWDMSEVWVPQWLDLGSSGCIDLSLLKRSPRGPYRRTPSFWKKVRELSGSKCYSLIVHDATPSLYSIKGG